MLAHGRCFSPGTPASFTTKTGRHDTTEILLKGALITKNQSIKLGKNVDKIVLCNYNLYYQWLIFSQQLIDWLIVWSTVKTSCILIDMNVKNLIGNLKKISEKMSLEIYLLQIKKCLFITKRVGVFKNICVITSFNKHDIYCYILQLWLFKYPLRFFLVLLMLTCIRFVGN